MHALTMDYFDNLESFNPLIAFLLFRLTCTIPIHHVAHFIIIFSLNKGDGLQYIPSRYSPIRHLSLKVRVFDSSPI
jgi:hypothetical protein